LARHPDGEDDGQGLYELDDRRQESRQCCDEQINFSRNPSM